MDKQEREFFQFIAGIMLMIAALLGLIWLFTNAF